MNEIFRKESNIFQNPENKPLEDLLLKIEDNGICRTIPALDQYWVEEKKFLYYEILVPINLNDRRFTDSQEQWLELTNFMNDDLIWLLHLPFYKFWSNIIFNDSIMNSIITFLQDAPSSYIFESFLTICDLTVKEHFYTIRKNILLVLARLVTNRESYSEYISNAKHAYLLYNKYIFTVPTLMDLCQQYGRDNMKVVEKIVNSVFKLQPFYHKDLGKAVTFIIQVLTKIEKKFDNAIVDENTTKILIDKGEVNSKINFSDLEYTILYLLDIVSTISIFLDIYIHSIESFKVEEFITKLISIYGNTIPKIYERLDDLAFIDEIIPKYVQLKHKLDIIRIEILKIYRKIIFKNIKQIIDNSNFITSEISDILEDFFINLMHTLSEKEFVIDYYNVYPITNDFQTILKIQPNLDTVKCDFITNSIYSFFNETDTFSKSISIKKSPASNFVLIAGPSHIQNNYKSQIINKNTNIDSKTNINYELDLSSIVSDVKEILCHLSEEMIQKCLIYYNYDKEAVIHAFLENCLPFELDSILPYTTANTEKVAVVIDSGLELETQNICDNDEFNFMTKKNINISTGYKGKRKQKYKDLNRLLNDKSHIIERKDIYNNYSIVISEYEDEYDDTYDERHIGSNPQNDVEMDAKHSITSKVEIKQDIHCKLETVEENEFPFTSTTQTNNDHSINNPSLLRGKIRERRLLKPKMVEFNPSSRNVESNKKDLDQSKDVIHNRIEKNKHKASRANHHRRISSQYKRNCGILPL